RSPTLDATSDCAERCGSRTTAMSGDKTQPERPHPGESALRKFLSGQLSGADATAVGEHINDCEFCRQILEGIKPPMPADLLAKLPASPHGRAESPPAQIGRYRVERVLGEGAFGRVYLARDHELDRPVAIKVPHRDRIRQPRDIEA